MKAKCIDNSHTWRGTLTINKEYDVTVKYSDPHAGYSMIEIVNDSGVTHPYRADRFIITEE